MIAVFMLPHFVVISPQEWERIEAAGPIQLSTEARDQIADAMAELGFMHQGTPALPAARAKVIKVLADALKTGEAFAQSMERLANRVDDTPEKAAGMLVRFALAPLDEHHRQHAEILDVLRHWLIELRAQGRSVAPATKFAQRMREIYRAEKGQRGGHIRFIITAAGLVGCPLSEATVDNALKTKKEKSS